MIRSRRDLLFIAALTVIVGLVVLFPARVAYRWAAPPQLALNGISGTVWSGSADAASTYGVFVRDLNWRIKPLRLLTGRAVYRVEGTPVSGFVETDVGIGFGGSLSLSDLSASVPLSLFAGPLRISGLGGNASIQFERIELQDGLPVAADGIIEVADLVAPRASRAPIGGYRAEFFTQNNGVVASVEDTGGVLDLAGSLQLKDDRSYQFIAQLVAKPEASAELKRQLQYLPPADERGQQELRIEGSL